MPCGHLAQWILDYCTGSVRFTFFLVDLYSRTGGECRKFGGMSPVSAAAEEQAEK